MAYVKIPPSTCVSQGRLVRKHIILAHSQTWPLQLSNYAIYIIRNTSHFIYDLTASYKLWRLALSGCWQLESEVGHYTKASKSPFHYKLAVSPPTSSLPLTFFLLWTSPFSPAAWHTCYTMLMHFCFFSLIILAARCPHLGLFPRDPPHTSTIYSLCSLFLLFQKIYTLHQSSF